MRLFLSENGRVVTSYWCSVFDRLRWLVLELPPFAVSSSSSFTCVGRHWVNRCHAWLNRTSTDYHCCITQPWTIDLRSSSASSDKPWTLTLAVTTFYLQVTQSVLFFYSLNFFGNCWRWIIVLWPLFFLNFKFIFDTELLDSCLSFIIGFFY